MITTSVPLSSTNQPQDRRVVGLNEGDETGSQRTLQVSGQSKRPRANHLTKAIYP